MLPANADARRCILWWPPVERAECAAHFCARLDCEKGEVRPRFTFANSPPHLYMQRWGACFCHFRFAKYTSNSNYTAVEIRQRFKNCSLWTKLRRAVWRQKAGHLPAFFPSLLSSTMPPAKRAPRAPKVKGLGHWCPESTAVRASPTPTAPTGTIRLTY